MKFNKKDAETEILFDTRPTQVTDVTRPYSSMGTPENPVQPYTEPAWGTRRDHAWKQHGEKPLRDNNDQAQGSCFDLRLQGEQDRPTDDEERKRSMSKSMMKRIFESANKNKLMAEIFPNDDDKESTKKSLKMPRTSFKHKAILKLMKCS